MLTYTPPQYIEMAHIHADQKKLLVRVSRIRGQLAAIDSSIREDRDCNVVLQTIAACRGALSGLMAEVVEGHVRYHVIDPKRKPTREQLHAADQLLVVVKSYLR